jgi:hypothetical protein
LPRIGPWVERVDRFLQRLEGEATRDGLTLIRIYKKLRALRYGGSFDAVRRYAKTLAKARRSVATDDYVPLNYAPGEACQVDFSPEIVLIGGVEQPFKRCATCGMVRREKPQTASDGNRKFPSFGSTRNQISKRSKSVASKSLGNL